MPADWIKEIVDETLGKNELEIGKTVKHIPTGKNVEITAGQYWGARGISNFWYWKFEDGETGHGYGYDLEVL